MELLLLGPQNSIASQSVQELVVKMVLGLLPEELVGLRLADSVSLVIEEIE